MTLIYILLGWLIGIANAALLLALSKKAEGPVERIKNQISGAFMPKGEILEPPNEEFEDFINNLPKQ